MDELAARRSRREWRFFEDEGGELHACRRGVESTVCGRVVESSWQEFRATEWPPRAARRGDAFRLLADREGVDVQAFARQGGGASSRERGAVVGSVATLPAGELGTAVLGDSTATEVSTIAAAVAALAALAAVLIQLHETRRARLPWLSIQVSQILDQGKRIIFTVENTGGGFAHEVMFCVMEGSQACIGGLPPTASLGPGQRVTVATALTPQDREAKAFVRCRSGARIFAWSGAGLYKHWRLNWWAIPKPESVDWELRRFFPDADVKAATIMSYQLEPGP